MTNAHAWDGTVSAFLQTPDTTLIELFRAHHRKSSVEQPSQSHETAWRDSWKVLRASFQQLINLHTEVNNWFVVFEYELPRERGRRPDAIILTGRSMFVLEFKGFGYIDNAHVDQVHAYVRDFVAYHSTSHAYAGAMLPILVPTRMKLTRQSRNIVQIVSPDLLADTLWDFYSRGQAAGLMNKSWLNGEYEPLPTLVRAARIIFNNEPFPQIRRAASSGVEDAMKYAIKVAEAAEARQERHLVLITGVPGAGKTLVGIRFVYEYAADHNDERNKAIMLSGNGPLVNVLQHALRSRVFVQDVHGFLKTYTREGVRPPKEHIIIYDEAQRAWDAERSAEKRGTSYSEPDDFLLIGSRQRDWSMMIALIGQGQEIHLGEEAGLSQWNTAVHNAKQLTGTSWIVHTPKRLSHIFADADKLYVSDKLDLDQSLRSHVAEEVQEWVSTLLNGTNATLVDGQKPRFDASVIQKTQQLSKAIKEDGFVLYVTRDVELAKTYAQHRYVGEYDKRYGLLASSKAKCLPQFGIDNDFQATRRLREGPWFNDEPSSPYSCCQLDAVATEFACQGLELDLPIVCWGDDVRFVRGQWVTPPMNRSSAKDPHRLRINAYRVLLSRGRDGMVIYVPPIPTLDETFALLVQAGCDVLSQDAPTTELPYALALTP
jgi:hypothetical protein